MLLKRDYVYSKRTLLPDTGMVGLMFLFGSKS